MTTKQIEQFCKKQAYAKSLEIKAINLHIKATEYCDKNLMLCDHRLPDGEIAGSKFKGSYCGFICSICSCSVSYEVMGY